MEKKLFAFSLLTFIFLNLFYRRNAEDEFKFLSSKISARDSSINTASEKPVIYKRISSPEAAFEQYNADLIHGLIGTSGSHPVDDPHDNIFHVQLPAMPDAGKNVFLEYDLYGVTNASGISKSINQSLSCGGLVVKLNKEWSAQAEIIDRNLIQKGDNVIHFSVPSMAGYLYEVKNIRLAFREATETGSFIVVNSCCPVTIGNKIYLSGFIKNDEYKGAPDSVQLFYNDKPVLLQGNHFEFFAERAADSKNISLKAITASGSIYNKKILLPPAEKEDYIFQPREKYKTIHDIYKSENGLFLSLQSGNAEASISIPPCALTDERKISITALSDIDLPAFGSEIINVTKGAAGYRFLPHGSHFEIPAFISLSFDSCLIPEGYTAADVRTYFFNEVNREWEVLPLDTIIGNKEIATSLTTHFTDMINGIIKVPESPQTQGYTHTSIKDFKASDPSTGIEMINPPNPNSMGNAGLDFNLKVPKGRAGLQPELALHYSNEGGNSWTGIGWNFSVPAITIDTRWGAPRYDAGLETESYSLNGESLAPVINRSALPARTAEKRFYPRTEGAFNKIIRHGNNPNNYWWEVTNKNGTRNFYGGTPEGGVAGASVLKDDAGNVGYWALTETRDLNNNNIHYQYQTINDPGVSGGSVPGVQLYISKIFYTGNGSTYGPYSIEFIRDRDLGEGKRKDAEINGKLGFKMVTADLLRKVTMKLNGVTIRSYELTYREGAYYKTLLKNISELDAAGNLFYTHGFDYFDDVQSASGYAPLKAPEAWNPQGDGIKGNLITNIPGFTDEASTLSTSTSSNYGAELALTIGLLFGGCTDKTLTIGGKAGFNSSEEEGIVAMTDITGDGLPDKIISKDGQLFYRRNLGEGLKQYDVLKLVSGLNQFSESNTSSFTWGVEVIPYFGSFTYETTTSTNTTTTYFSDFNADGLTDISISGTVFFNHLDNVGEPVFEPTSTATPNPIFTGFGIDKTFFAPDTALQAKLEKQYPLQDIVRLWRAPFDGNVSIIAPVQLIDRNGGLSNPKKDGVRVSIQSGANVVWSADIKAADFSVKTPTGIGNIALKKGQYLYFRVQSKYNGEDDEVIWNPEIKYLNTLNPATDANGKASSEYKASTDFLISHKNGSAIIKDGTIRIEGNFNKKITSDSVWLSIRREDTLGASTTLFQKLYSDKTIANEPVTIASANVKAGDMLYFSIFSDSYIDRSSVELSSQFQYTSFSDGSPVTDNNGNPLYVFYAVADQSNYNDWYKKAVINVSSKKDTIKIRPIVQGNSTTNGSLVFTVKSNLAILAKRKLNIVGGNIVNAIQDITLERNAAENYFFDFATADRTLATQLTKTRVSITKDSGYYNNSGNWVIVQLKDTMEANLYTEPDVDYYGTLFRGWGQFSFKGETNDTKPLDESKLSPDEASGYPTDVNAYTDSASLATLQSPALMNFITMYPKGKQGNWQGADSSVFTDETNMGSARLIVHDVGQDSLMVGENLTSVNRVVETEATTLSLGASVGSVGASYTSSNAETRTIIEMQDINGDNYPDVVNENDAQYTYPNGGLEQFARVHGAGTSINGAASSGFSLGGDGPDASPLGVKITKNGASANIQVADASIGVNVGFPTKNDDETKSALIDMNADGLPDRVYNDGNVSLNIGYRFLPQENWGISGINTNTSISNNAGLGINLVAGSWQFGVGVNRTEGSGNQDLSDINGDGLPDKISLSGSVLNVQLNTGSGFGPVIYWKDLNVINSNVSTGESVNAAYSICIPIPIPFLPLKIVINPKVNAGQGVSRRKDLIQDINGDGYPDLLHSDNDGQLTAALGTMGRTNMLKSVQRPMGSSFTIDYVRMGNTYDMPQSKWVLSSVEMFDGLKGDGIDTMRKTFTYSGGLYNRREREFYGFDTVITNELNTATSNTLYRKKVQHFINTSYYAKGLLASEWMEDGNANKYTQTDNLYELRKVQDSVYFPALLKTTQLFYEGQPVAGISTSMQFDYDAYGNMTTINDAGDGSSTDLIMAKVTYHDNDALYLKSTPASITVTTAEGEKRRRSTTIDGKGNITQISQFLADGTVSNWNMDYDLYGNLDKITRPLNYKNQRMWYAYQYDAVTHSFVTKVSDAFGYTSSSVYDLRFGELLSTKSMNDEVMNYTLDDKGRISSLTGPYEIAAGKAYTIKFEYYPDANVPYAITHHYDPEYDDDINTYTFTDGLARPVQVKKAVSLFKGKGVADDLAMVVSGRVVFDAFGRTTESYYPTTEPVGTLNTQLSTAFGNITSAAQYDVLDRNTQTILADGAISKMAYTIKDGYFSTTSTDPLNNIKESYTDVKQRNRQTFVYGGPAGTITTRFFYNALSELTLVKDNGGNATTYTYDNLGRKLSVQHPDAGLTEMQYDPAGNLIKKITPQIRKEIPNGGAIQYQYDYERISDIDYPRYYQNKVKYIYGAPGTGRKTGRLILQEDASGGQEFFYGPLGEVVKTIRTMVINPVYAVTYVSEQEYDTWNRVKTMTYPDGEKLTYHYNKAGGLYSMDGEKKGNIYKYVNQLGYDEYEQRVYLQYGNGTENTYTYEPLRRRLSTLQSYTAKGTAFMNNTYQYDAVSNILGIENNTTATTPGQLGGHAKQSYVYDNLYRLTNAAGEYQGITDTTGYKLTMAYDNLWNIVSKEMIDSIHIKSYKQLYEYKGAAPHQPSKIGLKNYRYDLNGNMLGDGFSDYFWDEENRLMGVLNNGILSEYTYDANGERAVKSSGGVQGIWVNGAPAGQIRHYDNYTAYISPYLVCRRTDFTKHYYIESQRITTKMGNGEFSNISFPKASLTAGGVDYIARMKSFEIARQQYYATLGVSPGPPTDKNFWARPENNGIAAPILVDSTASNIPPGWPQGNTTPPWQGGPPIFVTPIPSNDSVHAGYGFNGTGFEYEKNQYFYHPDHLGSTSYVTDALGNVNQHYEYSAFGETFYQEHATDYKVPYLFNAKEKDAETGLYYYGARYYNPETSIWQSVDPMAGKYPGLSPYNFNLNNPIKLTDKKGLEPKDENSESVINGAKDYTSASLIKDAAVRDQYDKNAASLKPLYDNANKNNPSNSKGLKMRLDQKIDARNNTSPISREFLNIMEPIEEKSLLNSEGNVTRFYKTNETVSKISKGFGIVGAAISIDRIASSTEPLMETGRVTSGYIGAIAGATYCAPMLPYTAICGPVAGLCGIALEVSCGVTGAIAGEELFNMNTNK